jgi:glycine/D-amino acid oxidase-like deaminating enzyme
MFLKRWRSLAPGGLEGWRSGHETLGHWRLDRPTPMERMRILDPAPDHATIRLTQVRALELLPELRKTSISAAWAGYIDSTPDGVPAIGEIGALPGLFLAAGFSGHGFGIGPGAGHLVADLATGATPIVDPAAYDPRRFEGSAWGKVADF